MSNVEHQVEAPQAPLPAKEIAVHPSALRELAADPGGTAEGTMGLGVLMDMPVKVTVEVGRIAITLGELCRLGPGALLKLDREAHQPADILVNGKVVARGEIVTVNESYGVRITDVSP
jgi:flagellar motor switch protein FliN/FliY